MPGDNPAAPTGAVNGAPDTPLCGQQLQAMMQARGIAMPQGRAEGAADAYVYLDSNGLPHQLELCFGQLSWSEPGASVGSHVERPRNVMRMSGLTPALAGSLDRFIDGRVDPRFGQFRELVRPICLMPRRGPGAWTRATPWPAPAAMKARWPS